MDSTLFTVTVLMVFFWSYSLNCQELSETENSGNRVDSNVDSVAVESKNGFSNNIKDCIQTCRRLLFRGDRDLNYCIEGCRIRIYRKIYECVYDQCNEKGNGIPTKFSREQYHQCVYLCKVKPKIKANPTTKSTPFTTTTTASPHLSTVKTSLMKDSSKLHFIPLEYHYFNDKKRKTSNKNSLK